MNRVCVSCGKTFAPLVGNQKKCALCKGYKPASPAPKKVICILCGKEFETTIYNKKFCSRECRNTFHYSPQIIHKHCEHCGKAFETTQMRQKYCSVECRLAHWTPIRVTNIDVATEKVTDHQEELEVLFDNAGDRF